MTEAEVRYVKRLPSQLEAARRKVEALEATARRYGMKDMQGGRKQVVVPVGKPCKPHHLFEVGPARAAPKTFPFADHRSLEQADFDALAPIEKRRAYDRKRYNGERRRARAA